MTETQSKEAQGTGRRRRFLSATLLAAIAIPGSLFYVTAGERARIAFDRTVGDDPEIAEPVQRIVPTIDVAEAMGWPEGRTPIAAPGLKVQAFASGLTHPRWMLSLPNGDILVAETNAPPRRPDKSNPVRDFFMKRAMKKVGAMVPFPDRITLLRDADGDGYAEFRSVLAEKLNSPFGMAYANGRLFIANADSLVALPFTLGQTRINAAPVELARLPAGRNHHWTKSLQLSADGRKLYVGVGSNSNVGENGIANENGRAAVWEFDIASGEGRIFASGLRNPVGLALEPSRSALWVVVQERDELGSDLVPDYLTSLRDGGFYGWPWSYFGAHVDTRVEPARPDLVAKAIKPDFALGPHVGALGLTFAEGSKLGPAYREGAFVGQHGSWNRSPPSGYKVVFIPFSGGRPVGKPIDILTGFRIGDKAFGRPVGVQFAADGALLVADDTGDRIWRVAAH